VPAATDTASRAACARSAGSRSGAAPTFRSTAPPNGTAPACRARARTITAQPGQRAEDVPPEAIAERRARGDAGEDHEHRRGREAEQRAGRAGRPEERPRADPREGQRDEARVVAHRCLGDDDRDGLADHGEPSPPQPCAQAGARHAQRGVQAAQRRGEAGDRLVDRHPDRERPDRGERAGHTRAPVDAALLSPKRLPDESATPDTGRILPIAAATRVGLMWDSRFA